MKIEQGDILRVNGLPHPAVVVSNNFFNESGFAVVCPIVDKALSGPLHISISTEQTSGYVLCEHVRYVDLGTRRFSRLGHLDYFDTLNISDAVMGIFDYQVF